MFCDESKCNIEIRLSRPVSTTQPRQLRPTMRAVNNDARIPRVSEIAKPFTGPVAFQNKIAAVISVDFVLEGDWAGERLRDFAYSRDPGVVVHGPHRGAELSRLGCRYRTAQADLDVAFDFIEKHQLPRQGVHRLHDLTRAAVSRRRRILHSRREKFWRRFSRWRP